MADGRSRQSRTKSFEGLPSDRRGRKAAIVGALYNRMKICGYADISLTDIAREADLSVSHMLYYYQDKETILLDLARLVVTHSLSDVFSDEGEDLALRIDHISRRIIVERSVAGVLLEARALAVHSQALREFTIATSEAAQLYFSRLFRDAPRQLGMSADAAAKSAISLWLGLLDNVHFGFAVSEKEAQSLFRTSLFWLANVAAPEAPATI